MKFNIKLTQNFGPLSISFNLRRLFSAKNGHILCIWPKNFESKWPRWFFLVHWNKVFTTIKAKFKIFIFSIFAFLRVPMGYVESSDSLYRGFQWIDFKTLPSMLLYNNSSYFKSGEINSCRLSPNRSMTYWLWYTTYHIQFRHHLLDSEPFHRTLVVSKHMSSIGPRRLVHISRNQDNKQMLKNCWRHCTKIKNRTFRNH